MGLKRYAQIINIDIHVKLCHALLLPLLDIADTRNIRIATGKYFHRFQINNDYFIWYDWLLPEALGPITMANSVPISIDEALVGIHVTMRTIQIELVFVLSLFNGYILQTAVAFLIWSLRLVPEKNKDTCNLSLAIRCGKY